MGIILTPGDKVIVHGNSDDSFEGGTFLGVTLEGHAVIEIRCVYINSDGSEEIDTYNVTRYMHRVEHAS